MVTAFSFCLYGPENSLYYQGLLENLVLINRHFPDWVIYTYLGSDVPESFVRKVESYNNIRVRHTGIDTFENRIRRFFAIHESDVEVMFVRDADSRVHWKDRWAIRNFLSQPYYESHSIRDHKEHTALLLAGLWGMRKSAGVDIFNEYEEYKRNPVSWGFAEDQDFLCERIYPKLKSRMLVHAYNERVVFRDEKFTIFPFLWADDIYCGKIERDFIDSIHPYEYRIKREPLYFLKTALRR